MSVHIPDLISKSITVKFVVRTAALMPRVEKKDCNSSVQFSSMRYLRKQAKWPLFPAIL